MGRKTEIEKLFMAIEQNKFTEAKNYLDMAKKELELLQGLETKFPSSVGLARNVITAVEEGNQMEAITAQKKAIGPFRLDLKFEIWKLQGMVSEDLEESGKQSKPSKKSKEKSNSTADLAKKTLKPSEQHLDGKTIPSLQDNRQNSIRERVQHTPEETINANKNLCEGKNENMHQRSIQKAEEKAKLERVSDDNISGTGHIPKTQNNVSAFTADISDKSKFASRAVQRNNPDIADLSDTNRPTKLAERFSELYDNEWTEAFDFLHNKKGLVETDTINYLLCIVQEAYRFCAETADRQVEELSKSFLCIIRYGSNWKNKGHTGPPPDQTQGLEDRSALYQIRKESAGLFIPELKTKYAEHVKNKLSPPKTLPAKMSSVDHYSAKAVELTWWMCVQDPPVYMCSTDGSPGDYKNLYRAYTKSGNVVDFYVWPALRLYKDGGVLAKGVVQYQ